MRVLLPVDNDEDRALAAAEAVTVLPDAADAVQVTLLNVQPELDVHSGDGGVVRSEDWYDEDDYPPSVDAVEERLQAAGVTVERRREHADPATAIVEVAEELDADRIVMAGRKRTPVGKVLFGSVTQSVLLNAPMPVTVVAVPKR